MGLMRSVLFAAALVLATTTVSAQTVVTSFSDLSTVVKSGDTVDVTDAKGRTLRGRIGELSQSSLELTARQRASDGSEPFVPIGRFSEPDVRQIRLQRRDSVLNGTLIGLAIGLGIAAFPAAGIFCGGSYEDFTATAGSCAGFLGILGGIGAGAGLAVDAARVERRMVYYKASVRF
jgi:hypothetical protein